MQKRRLKEEVSYSATWFNDLEKSPVSLNESCHSIQPDLKDLLLTKWDARPWEAYYVKFH